MKYEYLYETKTERRLEKTAVLLFYFSLKNGRFSVSVNGFRNPTCRILILV